MKRKVMIGSLIIVGILVTITWFVFSIKKSINNAYIENKKIETYEVSGSEKVYINGMIKPVDKEIIYKDLTKGEIKTVHVEEGATVQVGDPLITYSNKEVENQISSLKRDIELQNIEKKDYENEKENINKSLQATSTLETEQKEILKSKIEAINEQIKVVDKQIKAINYQVESLNKEIEFTVTSRIEGKVHLIEEKVETDGQSPFLTISNVSFEVVGQVSEKDREKIDIGKKATVKIIASKNEILGSIKSIADYPTTAVIIDTSQSFSFYDIAINLDNQENLVDGYHVQAIISLEDYLDIPENCIVKKDDKSYVYIESSGKREKREVTVIEITEGKAKISSGINENEQLLLNPEEEEVRE